MDEPQVIEIELESEATKELISKANQAYNTEINDLLLTGIGYALKDWSGRAINHITLEGHGREFIRDDIDLSKTVGWFTTAYPVKLEIKEDLSKSIKSIQRGFKRDSE